MRVAAFFDIHGNLPALEATLIELRRERVDRIVIGGDVLPGPMPRETIDAILNLGVPTDFIVGNGDRESLEFRRGAGSEKVPEHYRESMRWIGEGLTPADVAMIERWPLTVRLDIPGLGGVLFCHATVRNDTEIFTKLTSAEKLLPVFAGVQADVIVCGHTHMPFDRQVGLFRIVNAGSVGMPFGETGADWLLLGPDVQPRHTTYDLVHAADRIRQTSYPLREEFAAKYVLNPPTPQEILDSFGRFELQ